MLFLPFRPGTHDFSRIGTQAYRIVKQYIDMYFERYMKMAPAFSTRESIKRMKPNRLYFVNRYIPDSISRAGAFYKEFLMPQDQFYFLLGKLVAYDTPLGGLAIHRSESMGRFEDDEISELERLMPHLARAMHYVMHDRKPTLGDDFDASRLEMLTPTQQRIATLVRDGLSNRDIAMRMGIREQSVKDHLRRIYRRLGVHSRTSMIAVLFK